MSRKRVCARSLNAGPGSCGYWWESCPATVAQCFQRFVRERGGQVDLDTAKAWEAERDRVREPEPKLV